MSNVKSDCNKEKKKQEIENQIEKHLEVLKQRFIENAKKVSSSQSLSPFESWKINFKKRL